VFIFVNGDGGESGDERGGGDREMTKSPTLGSPTTERSGVQKFLQLCRGLKGHKVASSPSSGGERGLGKKDLAKRIEGSGPKK